MVTVLDADTIFSMKSLNLKSLNLISRKRFLRLLASLVFGWLLGRYPLVSGAAREPKIIQSRKSKESLPTGVSLAWKSRDSEQAVASGQKHTGKANQPFPLGSVMKLFTAAVLLETDLVSRETRFECRGTTRIPGSSETVHCLKPHGRVNLTEALGQSCNGYFVQATAQLSFQRWKGYLVKWGMPFQELTEARDGKAHCLNAHHYLGLTSCVVMTSRNLLPLIEGLAYGTGWASMIAAETRHVLREGMILAAQEGTGRHLPTLKQGRMAIKTGTVPYQKHFQSWVVGFFPADQPEVVFALQDSRGSSQDKAIHSLKQWLLSTAWSKYFNRTVFERGAVNTMKRGWIGGRSHCQSLRDTLSVVLVVLLASVCLSRFNLAEAGGLNKVSVRLFDQIKQKSQVQVFAMPGTVVKIQGGAKQGSLSRQTVFQCKAGQVSGGGFSAQKMILSGQSAGHPVMLAALSTRLSEGAQVQNKGSRKYLGEIVLTAVSSGSGCSLSIVNQVPLAGYLASVISSETGGGWPLEALKAQAVLTQTRLAQLKPHETVSDTTQYELYLGEGRVRPEARDAVQAVWHRILTYQNRPADVYYHASCGGHTAGGEWFNPANKAKTPYLISKPCPYCKIGPFQKPTQKEIPASVFQAAFPTGRSGLDGIKIKKMDDGGHPVWVEAGGAAPLSGYQFWLKLGQKLGWDKVPGSRFTLKPGLSKTGESSGRILLSSVGAGHGVGMCQWGAAGMAKQGKSVVDILAFYFPGTQLHAW